MLRFYKLLLCVEMFFISIFISWFINYLVIKYANKHKILLDMGNSKKPQKMHFENTPRAGGIGIFISICISILSNNYYLLLLIPMCLVFISGIMEDFSNNTKPKTRLLLQTLASVISIWLINSIIVNIGFEIPFYIALPFSIFCIVGVINSINIIDGFNGLAGGFSIMVCISIATVSYIIDDTNIFYLSIFLCAGLIGFMLLNFPNAKIFLGDGGAYLIGFVLAILLIKLTQDNEISAWYGFSIMIYPIFEVLFSIYRKKVIKNTSATRPDNVHFHMLIYKRITRSNYITSIFIWVLNIPFILISTLFFKNTLILIMICIIFIATYITIYKRIVTFKWKSGN